MHHLIMRGCHLISRASSLEAASSYCCQNTRWNELGVALSNSLFPSVLMICFRSLWVCLSTVMPCVFSTVSNRCFRSRCFRILWSSLCTFIILVCSSSFDSTEYGTLLLGSVLCAVLFSRWALRTRRLAQKLAHCLHCEDLPSHGSSNSQASWRMVALCKSTVLFPTIERGQ